MQRQKRNRKKLVLGITGSFGSGKTSVARFFKAHGAYVIDADRLAHGCIMPGESAFKKVVELFGNSILTRNKTIDRKKLAKLVFGKRLAVKRLNRVIHPEVIRLIMQGVKNAPRPLVVIDAPLLFESGLYKSVDKVIVVRVNKNTQVARLLKKTRLSKHEIEERIAHQLPQRDKVRMADFIIDNSGSMKETKNQAECIRRMLWKN